MMGSPPPGAGRSARASGPGGGDGRAATEAWVVLAPPPPHPRLPSAVRPSPFRGGYTTRLVCPRRRLARRPRRGTGAIASLSHPTKPARPARYELPLRHLLLHPSAEIQRVGVAAIDVAGVVDRDGFDAVDLDGLQNEGHDLAVLDAADPDARLARRIDFLGRIIGH